MKEPSRFSEVVPVFKNVGERSTAKNYHLVSLLSVVSKIFEKLVNNRIVDRLGKCGIFSSDFQYNFRSSWSTADLLTLASDRIATLYLLCIKELPDDVNCDVAIHTDNSTHLIF